MTSFRKVVKALVSLIYPDICNLCGRELVSGEKLMCMHCIAKMPLVNDNDKDFNTVHRRIASTMAIDRAAAMFYYHKKSPYSQLILDAKYRSRPYIARHLGLMFARKLSKQNFFDDIDAIVPVPIHWIKKIRRGYNQSYMIALGISEVTGIPIDEHLLKARWHTSQTRLSRHKRWDNARGSYISPQKSGYSVTHVLVVDDVLTTGSTMLSACNALKQAHPTLRISVLTLAVAALSE